MKNLRLLLFMLLSITFSCNSDDNDDNSPAGDAKLQATINGGTYSNYAFSRGIHQITKGENGNTLSIDVSDTNGHMITLFLNGTNGFSSGTVKEMGNVDSNNFMNYVLIRQPQPQISYYSSSGNVTITSNREHPTDAGKRLISGNFDITASSIDSENTTSMTGSFTELDYED